MLAAFLLGTNPLVGEPVMLRGVENGQGFTFSQNGNCYVVFPEHVAGGLEETPGARCAPGQVRPRSRLQVIAEGAKSGTATPRFPFWCGIDLAVAQVQRDAAEACTATLDDLAPPRRATNASGEAVLLNVDAEGHVARWPMRVTRADYLTFDAVFDRAGDMTAMQGMSGGFLMMGAQPVGMALSATPEGTVRFMRIEEIHMNLSRWLGTQGAVAFVDEGDPGDAVFEGALPLRVLSVSAPATGPDTMPDHLVATSGAYVFEPRGPNTIELAVGDPGETTTVSRVRMRTDPDAGPAVPRGVVILVNASEAGGRWRSFRAGEMTPDGVFDTGPIAATYAKRVRIRITSAWGTGPVRLDQVVVE